MLKGVKERERLAGVCDEGAEVVWESLGAARRGRDERGGKEGKFAGRSRLSDNK